MTLLLHYFDTDDAPPPLGMSSICGQHVMTDAPPPPHDSVALCPDCRALDGGQ